MTSRFWWNHENTQLFVTSLSSSYSFVAAHILLYLARNSDKLLPEKKIRETTKKKQFFSRPNHEKKSKLTFQRLLPLLSLFSYLGTYPSLSNIFFSCYLLPLSKKENSILNMNLDNTSYVQIVWRKTIQILTINLGKKLLWFMLISGGRTPNLPLSIQYKPLTNKT